MLREARVMPAVAVAASFWAVVAAVVLGATMAALGEHILPLFILLGLATRLSALGLLGMTMVIQLFVYPDAYATHGTWAAVLLYLMAHGPGQLSIDAWIAKRHPA